MTYFINVNDKMYGDLYLNIVESKPTEGGSFLRQSVLVYQEDIGQFVKEMQKSLDYLKMHARKSMRPAERMEEEE